MRFHTAALAAILTMSAATVTAQEKPRAAGYDKLQMFVGTWTIGTFQYKPAR